MLESTASLDIESIVNRARSLWRDAKRRQRQVRVELFVKVSRRCRVTRGLEGTGTTFDLANESGLAVRVVRVGHAHAGFAAASGLTVDAVRWVADTAGTFQSVASGSAPGASDSVAAERWDLDAATALPTEEELTAGLDVRPELDWVEAGTTIEVLIGDAGWLAARRRHRLWALDGAPDGGLLAQRGFANWEKDLRRSDGPGGFPSPSDSGDLEVVLLAPEAAASVVAALVDGFHGLGSIQPVRSGHAWDVVDDPIRPDGLAGGSFDDVGFPAVSRVLAAGGLWKGRLGGPGNFRRASFREPPRESVSNLVMPSGTVGSTPFRAKLVHRCRILRLSNDLWVLELDLMQATSSSCLERRWVRVQPQALLESCVSKLGGARVTATGPIVPWLRLDGIGSTTVKP